MKPIFLLLRAIFQGFWRLRSTIPFGVASFFLGWDFIQNWFNEGFVFAFKSLARQILAAESVIRENVMLAVENSPKYAVTNFIAILVSLFILYNLTKLVKNVIFVGMTGSQAPLSAWGGAIILVGIVEIAAMNFIEGVFFIPFYDGVFFLFMNLGSVFNNMHIVAKDVVVNATNISNTSNVTITEVIGDQPLRNVFS